MKGEQLKETLSQLKGWNVVDEHHLTRTYKFKDFAGPLAFVNKVAPCAKEQGPHPDISSSWGKVKLVERLRERFHPSPPRSIRFPPE